MTVQDNIPSIVTEIDQILVQLNTLSASQSQDDRAAIAAVLERVRRVLVTLPNRAESPNTIAQQSTAQEIAQWCFLASIVDWATGLSFYN
ncbi:MAG: hypothetical protein HC847_19650 [Hydrococcus sp. RU_2_2]|nr:hypothetical protein [Hydrococcus sp. RU_2_2]